MESFLKQVAADLYRRTGGDLAHTVVVFPNKRASLFFNEHLAREAGRPVWSPAYLSISELFRGLSAREVADPVKLVCELYRVFLRETHTRESLDEFYFWGEMLIDDFDDVDKNLVDTRRLFANLQDLRRLADDHSYLDREQEEALRQFFRNFSVERRTELKDRFITLWESLGRIYDGFREVLSAQGLAYEGMICREVVERLDISTLSAERYVFVGFNVLNRAEHTLFTRLQEAGRALFYWDYDRFYADPPAVGTSGHEAGEFLRRNLRDFPSALPAVLFDNLSGPKEIRYVASPTETAQARYLPHWLRANLTPVERETAVVLCNEALLQPVLHSLPAEVRQVNVTMGFPLVQTPVCGFLSALLDVHVGGYDSRTDRYAWRTVAALLRHPYVRRISPKAETLLGELTTRNRFYPAPVELCLDEALTLLFTPVGDNLQLCDMAAKALAEVARCGEEDGDAEHDALRQLYGEALFTAYTTVCRFRALVEEDGLDVRPETLRRLLDRVLAASTVPFHGEPAVGLQVMGMLETRGLDFRHLVLLSVNEGFLPRGGGDTSFIPYNLRKAFGMTTLDHRIAVYAYYFYRLVQRAERVTFVYNTSSDGLNRGERSRFLLQLLVEWPHPVVQEVLEAGQSPQAVRPLAAQKTTDVMRRLQAVFDVRVNPRAKFSPSALNAYLDCPLKFYFRYVARLSAPDEVSADIDAATFGSIFHSAAEHVYRDLTAHGDRVDGESLDALLRDEVRLQGYVDAAFKRLFFHVPADEQPEYNGLQLINSAVIARYLRRLLEHDRRYAPFTFAGSEQEVTEDVDIRLPQGIIRTRIGGIVDRMDCKDGTLRVVDYKTGGDADTPPDVASLFIPAAKRSGYVFQTFLYAAILCRRQPLKVAPALLYIHRAAADTYSPVIQMGEPRRAKEAVDDFRRYEAEFRERLQRLLEEIFCTDMPFTQTDVTEKCAYCDFRSLCRR